MEVVKKSEQYTYEKTLGNLVLVGDISKSVVNNAISTNITVYTDSEADENMIGRAFINTVANNGRDKSITFVVTTPALLEHLNVIGQELYNSIDDIIEIVNAG